MTTENDPNTTSSQDKAYKPDGVSFEQAALDWGELEEKPPITIFGRVISFDSENQKVTLYAIEGNQTPWEAETYMVFIPEAVLEAYMQEYTKIARGECVEITGEIEKRSFTTRKGELIEMKVVYARTMEREYEIAALVALPYKRRG